MAGHLSQAGRTDTAHVQFAKHQHAGWETKFLAECRDRAAPGSAAHYYNPVVCARGGGPSAPPRAEVVMQRHSEWVRTQERRQARERQRAEQAERDAALGIDGGRMGARAESWGQAAFQGEPPARKDEGWAWLDKLEMRFLTALDLLTSRSPLPAHRKEYNDMIHVGFRYARDRGYTADTLRGFKYVVLAKAVTTGRLRAEQPRGVNEIRGRIRMVSAGFLEELTSELLRDATHYKVQAGVQEVEAKAEAERLAREVEAEAEALKETAQAAAAAAGADGQGAAREAAQQAEPAATEDGKHLGQSLDLEKKLLSVLRYCAAGYLSKGYAQFKASPLADVEKAEVRATLRGLHPQPTPPAPEELPDKERVEAEFTSKEAFQEVFAKPPQERAMSVDAVSYEELQSLYHGGSSYQATLLGLVRLINSGRIHSAAAEALGESLLVGLEKPDGGTRPIGIGAALRRLAGRCIMYDKGEHMGRVFTRTAPTASMLERAGNAGVRCNVPLQLGVGIKGGAEILAAIARLALQKERGWALFSDDKSNAFNTVSREAIYKGLVEWFPELIPAFQLFYSRNGKLFTVGQKGKSMAVDAEGVPYFSAEGCTQGDPLGPFYWAVGYHYTLLEVQARHPDVVILAYLDDSYYLQVPAAGLAAMRSGSLVTHLQTGVVSNMSKQEVYAGPECDLSAMPPDLRGAPTAPPNEAKGYAGGRLMCVKVLGAFLGNTTACANKLLARVEEHLAPLANVHKLRDTAKCRLALQVQLQINRFCANTSLNYFMRIMGPAASRLAAHRHDALVEAAFHKIVGTASATHAERSRAVQQARLPVKMGGLGLTAMSDTLDAACVGSWALCWHQMKEMCPQLFAHMDIVAYPLPAFKELRAAHATLQTTRRRMDAIYREIDAAYYDYDKAGEGHTQFHPEHLPPAHKLEPLTAYSERSKFHFGASTPSSSTMPTGSTLCSACGRALRAVRPCASCRRRSRMLALSSMPCPGMRSTRSLRRSCGWQCSGGLASRCWRLQRRRADVVGTGASWTCSATWRRMTVRRAMPRGTTWCWRRSMTRCAVWRAQAQ
jgi:hypothetical protein